MGFNLRILSSEPRFNRSKDQIEGQRVVNQTLVASEVFVHLCVSVCLPA